MKQRSMQKRIENNRENHKNENQVFEKINRINKPLARTRENIPLTKIRNEGGSITANITEINRAITESYE